MPKQAIRRVWWESATTTLLNIAFLNWEPRRKGELDLAPCLVSFVFAYCALEAYINDIHHAHFAHGMAKNEVQAWRRRHLELRLRDVTGGQLSARRMRTLRELREFRHSVVHPEPLIVREDAIKIANDIEVSSRRLIGARKHFLETRYRSTRLPGDPLDLEKDNLDTALLVLLREFVVLARRYPKWPPISRVIDPTGRVLSIEEWFSTLRQGYSGPHRAEFRRIRV